MGRQEIAVPVLKQKRRGPLVSPRRRFLLIALGLSVAVHLMAALLIILLPRALPRHAPPPEQGTVELLMVEQKGAKPSASSPPVADQPTKSPPTPPRPKTPAQPPEPQKPPEPPKPPIQTSEPPATAPPAPAIPQNPNVPAPKPAEQPPKAASNQAKPAPQPAPAQPPPAKPQQAPVFDLAGTESESNAVALGGHILPASPDNRFRNRPPIYPPEAEMRGEHGTVVVMIHVSEDGVASGVDVAQSSGVAVLDRAAVDAVRKWRFRPALKQGRTVPFDMPFRFIFEAD
jgi:protein TonB